MSKNNAGENPFASMDLSIANRGTLANPQPQLKYHADVHGKNVEFLEDYRVACRCNAQKTNNNAVTFSNRPIVVGECVALRVLETKSGWLTNFFSIGLCPDPKGFRSKKLKWALSFSRSEGVKTVPLSCFTNENLSILYFMLNEHGDLVWAKNDKWKGKLMSCLLDLDKPQWLLLDVHGSCCALEFMLPTSLSSKQLTGLAHENGAVWEYFASIQEAEAETTTAIEETELCTSESLPSTSQILESQNDANINDNNDSNQNGKTAQIQRKEG